MESPNQSVFDAALALPHTERFALAELLYSSLADDSEPLKDDELAIIEERKRKARTLVEKMALEALESEQIPWNRESMQKLRNEFQLEDRDCGR